MKKIFVGGLPFSYEDKDLAALFTPFGEVKSASIIRDRMMNNRSKGFGFVEMDAEPADAAIAALDGSDLDGRSLTVNEARPMTERPPRREYSNNDRAPRGNYGSGRDDRSAGRSRDY